MKLADIELKHLCAQHRIRVSSSERDALALWMELYQRGAKSYVDCRACYAKIYLRAAIEVALVRTQAFQNSYFNQAHLSRPMHLLEHVFDQLSDEEKSFYLRVQKILLMYEKDGAFDKQSLRSDISVSHASIVH